jgi:hypothetical protein
MPIDMSLAAKAPPRKTGTRATPARAQAAQVQITSVNDRRTDGLLGLAQLGQGLLVAVGLYADAAAVGKFFPPMAKELANVADDHDVLAKPIDFLIEIGPYGALIATGLPLIMQLAANHRLLDASRLGGQGVVPPELLEAQMKTQMARMQADVMRAQQAAMQEAKQLEREYEQMMAEYEKAA